MKQIDKYYLGGVISLILLMAGYLLLSFREPVLLSRIFAITWMLMVSLSAGSFISGIWRQEQLAMIRKRWKKEINLYRTSKINGVSQRVRDYNSGGK